MQVTSEFQDVSIENLGMETNCSEEDFQNKKAVDATSVLAHITTPPQQFQNKSPSFYLFSFNPKEIPRRFCRKSRTLICRCKNNKTTMDSLMKTKDFSWNEGVYCLQCIHVGELLRTSCHALTNVLEDQSVIKTLRTKKSSTGGGEKLSVSFELFE